jgi:hypothetical protein
MTVYEQQLTTYWTVDTPLNEYDPYEYEPEIVINAYNLPYDPVQRRMMMIVTFVLVGALLFVVLVMPHLASASTTVANSDTAQTANTVSSQAGTAAAGADTAGKTVNYQGKISAVFSDEVKYWEADIVRWASEHNLDPNMVATVMQIESCGDPQAVSIAGAQGLFQVMPFHFTAGENMQEPNTNARRGMNYLAERLVQTNGEVGHAFAGYNGGHVAAGSSWSNWAAETQRYYVWSTGIYADAQAGLAESPTLQEWFAAGGASLCRQAANRLNIR